MLTCFGRRSFFKEACEVTTYLRTCKIIYILAFLGSPCDYIIRGAIYSWSPVYKCPEIRPNIPEIQHEIPQLPAIPEIRPKISKIRLENLEIRREIPGIWHGTVQIRPEIPKSCTKSVKADFKSLKFLTPDLNSLKSCLEPLKYFKSLKSQKSVLKSWRYQKSDQKSQKSDTSNNWAFDIMHWINWTQLLQTDRPSLKLTSLDWV